MTWKFEEFSGELWEKFDDISTINLEECYRNTKNLREIEIR